MKAEIREDGFLYVIPETIVEKFALQHITPPEKKDFPLVIDWNNVYKPLEQQPFHRLFKSNHLDQVLQD
jgi:hypothetical protein